MKKNQFYLSEDVVIYCDATHAKGDIIAEKLKSCKDKARKTETLSRVAGVQKI